MNKKETTKIQDNILIKSAQTIKKNFGLDFVNKIKDLERSIISSAKELKIFDINDFIRKITENLIDSRASDVLVNHLTVGETFFFRDTKLFDAFQKNDFKKFVSEKTNRGRTLKIYSVACSSGEEPYSLSILLHRFFNHSEKPPFKIVAADINKNAISKAKKGHYKEWSFRTTPTWVKNDYFTKSDEGLFVIKPKVKKQVEFVIQNLSDINSFSKLSNKFDIILCRNVLIYFDKELIKELMKMFHQKLNDRGLFITTASESIHVSKDLFSKAEFYQTAVYEKRSLEKEFEKKRLKSLPKPTPEKELKPIKKSAKKREAKNDNTSNTSKLSLNQFFKNAIKQYEKGKLLEAQRILTTILLELKANKENFKEIADVYFYLAKTKLKLGKNKEAQKVCMEFFEINKLDFRLHYILGLILQEEGNFSEAESTLNKSIYLNNKFPMSLFVLGNLQMNMGKSSYKNNFRKALKLLGKCNPDDIIPYSDKISAKQLEKQINSLFK